MTLPRLSRSEIAVLVMIWLVLCALLATDSTGWLTCTHCGNDIEQKDGLRWTALGSVTTRRCLTRRPVTAECRHPPFGAGAVVVKRNGHPVAAVSKL